MLYRGKWGKCGEFNWEEVMEGDTEEGGRGEINYSKGT